MTSPIVDDFLVIEAVILSIVRFPEAVVINHIEDERGHLFAVDCHPSDFGFILGKEGRNINAMRTLLRCLGAKHKVTVALKINDNSPKP